MQSLALWVFLSVASGLVSIRWVAKRASCAWCEAVLLGVRLVRPCGLDATLGGSRVVSEIFPFPIRYR